MTRRNFRRILTALLLTAVLGPMTNAAPSAQLALIPNPTTEVKELILEAFLFPDDYRERISEYCNLLGGYATGSPLLHTSLSPKPSPPQARTVKTEYETLIKAPNPQQNGQKGNGGKGATSLALYDPKFAAKQLLKGGKISLHDLQLMIRNGSENEFKPSATIVDGYKFSYEINGIPIQIKWHAPDLTAAAKFPGSNSGSGWTVQIKVGEQLLGLDGKFYLKPSNLTHIPLLGEP